MRKADGFFECVREAMINQPSVKQGYPKLTRALRPSHALSIDIDVINTSNHISIESSLPSFRQSYRSSNRSIAQNSTASSQSNLKQNQEVDEKHSVSARLTPTSHKRVNQVFHEIRNFSSKQEMQSAICKLDDKHERVNLIDRILQRKQEMKEADELIRMTRVKPLVARFARQLTLRSPSALSRSKQQLQQSPLATISNQQTDANISLISETSLPHQTEICSEKKAIIIAQLFRQKPSKIDIQEVEPKHEFLTEYCESISKVRESTSKNINLSKVSENSSALIRKGQESQRRHVNEILREAQQQSLSAHFKTCAKSPTSKFATPQLSFIINTFDDPLHKPNHAKKLKSVTYATAAKEIKYELAEFFEKIESDQTEYLISPRVIKDSQSRSIESDARIIMLQKKEKSKVQQYTSSTNSRIPSPKLFTNQLNESDSLLIRSKSQSVSSHLKSIQKSRGNLLSRESARSTYSQTPNVSGNQSIDLSDKSPRFRNLSFNRSTFSERRKHYFWNEDSISENTSNNKKSVAFFDRFSYLQDDSSIIQESS